MSTFATDRPVTIVLDHYCSEYKYNVWCKQYKTVKFYPLVNVELLYALYFGRTQMSIWPIWRRRGWLVVFTGSTRQQAIWTLFTNHSPFFPTMEIVEYPISYHWSCEYNFCQILVDLQIISMSSFGTHYLSEISAIVTIISQAAILWLT